MEKISVLVPVYNVERYIRTCLDSIIHQTYENMEIILADDGSTDQSGAICDEYAKKDARIRVIHKRNEGLLWTRRVLLHQASGEYILCVDSDDYIVPDLLEKTIACAKKTGSDVILFGYDIVTDDGLLIRHVADQYPDGTIFCGEARKKLCQDFAVTGKLNHIWDKLIARDLFSVEDEDDPLYQQHIMGEDKLQLIPIFQRATCFCYLAQPLYCYRSSLTGMTNQFKMSYFQDETEVNQRILDFLQTMQFDDKACLTRFYHHYVGMTTSLTICAVHSRAFTSSEMKKCFLDTAESELFRQAVPYFTKLDRNLLHKVTFWMFQRRWFRPLILMLQAEQRMIRFFRRKKGA